MQCVHPLHTSWAGRLKSSCDWPAKARRDDIAITSLARLSTLYLQLLRWTYCPFNAAHLNTITSIINMENISLRPFVEQRLFQQSTWKVYKTRKSFNKVNFQPSLHETIVDKIIEFPHTVVNACVPSWKNWTNKKPTCWVNFPDFFKLCLVFLIDIQNFLFFIIHFSFEVFVPLMITTFL